MACQICGHSQKGIKYLKTTSRDVWKNITDNKFNNVSANSELKYFSTTTTAATSLNSKSGNQDTSTTQDNNTNRDNTKDNSYDGKLKLSRAQNEKLRRIRDRMIRVDHAGEYGANRIYAGQLAILGRTKSAPLIQHMWDQEKEHLNIFEKLIPKYRARPTVLLPFWNVAGYVLGAGTALLGEKAAMACTVAVEASITEHYNSQIRELMTVTDHPQTNKELLDVIQKCRDEEQEHHDTGLEQGAENTPGYNVLTQVIKTGCKTAIWLSERI